MNTALAGALCVALLLGGAGLRGDPAVRLALTEDLGAVSPGGRRDLVEDM